MSGSPVHDTELSRLRGAAAKIAASYGLELFDLQYRREAPGWVLRVVLDRPPSGTNPERGQAVEDSVGIEDCQRVSQDLSALLDVDEALVPIADRQYTLEVSSPGLDRPLRGEADYRRFVGRLAKIVTTAPVSGQSHFAGRLAGVETEADGDLVVTINEGRRVHRVPIRAIKRAKLEVEF